MDSKAKTRKNPNDSPYVLPYRLSRQPQAAWPS